MPSMHLRFSYILGSSSDLTAVAAFINGEVFVDEAVRIFTIDIDPEKSAEVIAYLRRLHFHLLDGSPSSTLLN